MYLKFETVQHRRLRDDANLILSLVWSRTFHILKVYFNPQVLLIWSYSMTHPSSRQWCLIISYISHSLIDGKPMLVLMFPKSFCNTILRTLQHLECVKFIISTKFTFKLITWYTKVDKLLWFIFHNSKLASITKNNMKTRLKSL